WGVARVRRRPHEAGVDHRSVPGRLARGVPRHGRVPPSRSRAGRLSVGRYPTADQLLEEAVEQSGLTDFGHGDFREGLAVLLDSLEHDGDLAPEPDAAVVGESRRRLVNRLELEAWYATHPEVDDVTVRGPVDINGLPRTGTTALADMLSLDPQFRSL